MADNTPTIIKNVFDNENLGEKLNNIQSYTLKRYKYYND